MYVDIYIYVCRHMYVCMTVWHISTYSLHTVYIYYTLVVYLGGSDTHTHLIVREVSVVLCIWTVSQENSKTSRDSSTTGACTINPKMRALILYINISRAWFKIKCTRTRMSVCIWIEVVSRDGNIDTKGGRGQDSESHGTRIRHMPYTGAIPYHR